MNGSVAISVKPKTNTTNALIRCFFLSAIIMMARPAVTPAQTPLEGPGSGLVGWWKLDDGSGSHPSDFSGNVNTGQFVGAPTWTSGMSGGALNFGGLVDFIRIPTYASLKTGVMTVAAWVNTSNLLKSSTRFFGAGGRMQCADTYGVWARPTGAIYASYPNASGTIIRSAMPGNAGTVQLGQWAHYVFTYSGNDTSVTISAYKNGSLAGTPYTASDGLANCGQVTALGSQEDLPNPLYQRTWAGRLKDFRVYNRVLSSDEITNLYNELKPTFTDTNAPSIPTGLTATAINSARVDLSWTASTDNTGVIGYIIYRAGTPIDSVRGLTSYSDIDHGVSTTFSYTVAPSTTYTYTVAAYDEAYNVSSQSASASAATHLPCQSVGRAVRFLRYRARHRASVVAQPAAIRFQVERLLFSLRSPSYRGTTILFLHLQDGTEPDALE
jgi:hypothetical protein